MARPQAASFHAGWIAIAPLVFVVMWSTGHIGTRLGMPYSEPFTFLAWRFALGTALMTAIALIFRAPWPTRWSDTGHILVAGLLLHAVYLGGVFVAISLGMTTGVLALITGMQPVLTAALVGPMLGERISARQGLGLLLGLGGTALVLWNKVSLDGLGAGSILAAVVAVLSIAFGAVYQKRFCANMDLRSGTALQLGIAAFTIGLCALLFETRQVEATGEFVFAVVWLVVVLSVGGYNLLYYLLRRGAAAKVTSLFYLTPPVTALMGYALFGETLAGTALLGMAVAVVGVALVNRLRGRIGVF